MRYLIFAVISACAASGAAPLLYDPGISPDGREIAFVSGGDIWTVPAAGGEARLLISHPAVEASPRYSPDGTQLAFTSNRNGGTNIFVFTLATGAIKRITFSDGTDNLSAWSADGKWLYFYSASQNIGGNADIFRVSSEVGTPVSLSSQPYVNQFQPAPSPAGDAIVFAARGDSNRQWWRNGSSHLDQSELWLLRGASYEKLVDRGARNNWPMWSPDGRTVYFMSDRGGTQNIWRKPLQGAAVQVTKFKDGRVLYPTISRDGSVIVFERDMRIWRLDTRNGQSTPVNITLRGAAAMPTTRHLSMTDGFSDLALSPDGKKVAFLVRGEVFAASAKDGGDARRVTNTAAPESNVSWSKDSKGLIYISARDGVNHIYGYDFAKNAETQWTREAQPDTQPVYSPDGNSLAFVRDGKELHVMDVATKQDRVVTRGNLGRGGGFFQRRSLAWSPDSKWIAYLASGEKLFRNLHVVRASGGDAKQISFLPNSQFGFFTWSPDAKFVLFSSGQRTEPNKSFRVDLTPRRPPFREEAFEKLFAEDKKPGPAVTEIATDGIKRRIRPIAPTLDVVECAITPDGKNAVMLAAAGGQRNIYLYSLDETAREAPVPRQITSTSSGKSNLQIAADGKDVFYLDNGRVQSVNLDTRNFRTPLITAEMDADRRALNTAAFDQAWTTMRDGFFDEKMNGVDWNAMRERFRPAAESSVTDDEFVRVLNLLFGELNASHLGASNGGTPTPVVGRLGLRVDHTLRILSLIPRGPAALNGKIVAGDTISMIDGAPVVNLDECLQNKIGKRVMLSIRHASGASETIALRAISGGAERQLLYENWVDSRAAYVERISGGKLAYVHIPDMSSESLDQLYLDLDEDAHARKGVVIDIRNNNGGFVNPYAIDVFARRPYLNFTPRGTSNASARSQLGQRALELPSVLVTNQHSLSDAEDFTEGYRSLKLGKTVGEPTAGWIIFTSSTSLIDGTSIRLPGIRVTTVSGENMERNPRPVDIAVSNPLGADNDAQLDAAVKELLRTLPVK